MCEATAMQWVSLVGDVGLEGQEGVGKYTHGRSDEIAFSGRVFSAKKG